MSNRLEQAFSRTNGQAPATLRRGGVSPETVEHYVDRGRQLRNQALRDSARAVVRAPLRVTAFVRCVASGAASRLVARDCRGNPAHGA